MSVWKESDALKCWNKSYMWSRHHTFNFQPNLARFKPKRWAVITDTEVLCSVLTLGMWKFYFLNTWHLKLGCFHKKEIEMKLNVNKIKGFSKFPSKWSVWQREDGFETAFRASCSEVWKIEKYEWTVWTKNVKK